MHPRILVLPLLALALALTAAAATAARSASSWPACDVLVPKAKVAAWLDVPPAYQRYMRSHTTLINDPKDTRGILRCSWSAYTLGAVEVKVGTFRAWGDLTKQELKALKGASFCAMSAAAQKVCADIG